jgi:hypothetical protein
MASIRKEIPLTASPDAVWAAVRDVGAPHTRLGPGFAVDAHLDGDARVVTFANGMVVRELIVDVSDEQRRVAYAAVGIDGLQHHHATMQVVADGRGARLVWIADVLPHAAAAKIGGLMEEASGFMKRALDAL